MVQCRHMGNMTVIFDFDGTLANTVELIIDTYNMYSEELGYTKIKHSEIPALRRLGYKGAMKKKGIKLHSLPRIALKLSREMRKHMDQVEPYDGIVDVLKKLQSKGLTIGVLTSNQASTASEFFETHKFPKFDFVVSEKTFFGKDRALRKIMKRFDLDQDQVIYVGDEPRDVTASHKAGVQVMGVTWGLAGEEGFKHHAPDKLIKTPKDLQETILELAGLEEIED